MAEPPVDPRRSELMKRVRRRDTTPELIVRRALRRLGVHYRLQGKDLPGNPDVVNRRRKLAIFVHGCFWHRHPGCRLSSTPKTRTEFWKAKFARNVERDRRAEMILTEHGWSVVVVWECQTKDFDRLLKELRESLSTTIVSKATDRG
ncbi:very short patch repair endonuclease [Mangrovicella endophytica]|uniref:very short patch repair endonuclease n=1 Tax=Mangrovicella endophytica TaxID=2066697 RepID=UPI001FDF6EF1|nr:very short patch repair endonuclease [Mangrovicella endophytica]